MEGGGLRENLPLNIKDICFLIQSEISRARGAMQRQRRPPPCAALILGVLAPGIHMAADWQFVGGANLQDRGLWLKIQAVIIHFVLSVGPTTLAAPLKLDYYT